MWAVFLQSPHWYTLLDPMDQLIRIFSWVVVDGHGDANAYHPKADVSNDDVAVVAAVACVNDVGDDALVVFDRQDGKYPRDL